VVDTVFLRATKQQVDVCVHLVWHLLCVYLECDLSCAWCLLRPPPPPPRLLPCRFDFNLSRPMTPEEVAQVERLVNSWVADAAPTTTQVG